jgi:hypothetical protein
LQGDSSCDVLGWTVGELQKWMAFGCHMWIFLHHFVLVGSVFQGENMGTK